jgi:hypothetical protein
MTTELTFRVTSIDLSIGNGQANVEFVMVDPENVWAYYDHIHVTVAADAVGEFKVGQLFVLKAVVQ